MPDSPTIRFASFPLGGGNPLVLIAGPCVIESEDRTKQIAEGIKAIADELGMPLVFKASYDKANRSSLTSFRGPGMEEGLGVLNRIRKEFDVPILSDVHDHRQAAEAGRVLDVLQIPAFLCRQTDLLVAAAKSGKTVNVKKGQFMSPAEMGNAIDKVHHSGNPNVAITERGTSFGYNLLVNDMRAIPQIQALGAPVIFDGTHSVQLPGGAGTASSGQREFIPALTRAAVAAGCDGLFLEVHDSPDEAKSDGPNMLPLDELKPLLETLLKIRKAVG